MERISKIQYYLDIALAVSKRSNCLKRHYGAVIVNNDEIISTGYNGSPRGDLNCCDTGHCMRLEAPRNSEYEKCKSVHAEQNAIISASRQEMIGSVLYLACEYKEEDEQWVEDISSEVKPCPICQRMINNAGIQRIITRNTIRENGIVLYNEEVNPVKIVVDTVKALVDRVQVSDYDNPRAIEEKARSYITNNYPELTEEEQERLNDEAVKEFINL